MADSKIPAPVGVRPSGVFPASDYPANAPAAIAYAAENGKAVIAHADGRVRVVISMPTSDLPPLGE